MKIEANTEDLHRTLATARRATGSVGPSSWLRLEVADGELSATGQSLDLTVTATSSVTEHEAGHCNVLGYFETVGRIDQLDRELRILAAVLALVWIRSIRIPTPVAMIVGKIAAASMWIFLLHWQVWPLFTPWLNDRVAYLITIGVGVAVWWIISRVGESREEFAARCERAADDGADDDATGATAAATAAAPTFVRDVWASGVSCVLESPPSRGVFEKAAVNVTVTTGAALPPARAAATATRCDMPPDSSCG